MELNTVRSHSTMGTAKSSESSVNWSPFDIKTSYQLGQAENWPSLRRILDGVVNRKFGVIDVASQVLIDEVRSFLDSSYGEVKIPHVPLTKRHILSIVIYAEKEEAVEILELLLATGIDPDKPSDKNWRPSHYCGFVGRLDLVSSLFLCRPDMTAKNRNGTPLKAAQISYADDRHHPAWKARRPFVAKFIKDNDFQSRFPTLAELAVQKKWFAIKNLVRRQAAASNEFTEALNGLTAAEWASHYGENLLADEIRYYQQPLTTRFARVYQELLSLTTENASLKKKIEKLETESKEKDSKIAELPKAVEH